MIEGVKITPLRQILDERGKVMHMLRCDSDVYVGFGEVYFSCVHPGAIKAWHIHTQMTLNYAVPHGNIKLVLFDEREDSKTKNEIQEIFLGPDNYCLVTIPPMVWNGIKGIGHNTAIVANCASLPHDGNEVLRRDALDDAIPYDWNIKHK